MLLIFERVALYLIDLEAFADISNKTKLIQELFITNYSSIHEKFDKSKVV